MTWETYDSVYEKYLEISKEIRLDVHCVALSRDVFFGLDFVLSLSFSLPSLYPPD